MAKHLINQTIVLPDNATTRDRRHVWHRHAATRAEPWPPPDPRNRHDDPMPRRGVPRAARIDPLIRKAWLAQHRERVTP